MSRTRLLPLAAVAAIAIASFGGAHAANLLVNGSFEVDNFNSGGGFRLGLNGNDVTGWFIPAGDGIYPWGLQNSNSFNAGPAADGNQWLVLGRYDTQASFSIQQTLSGLTPGSVYQLSFAIASERACCSQAEVSFTGSSTASQLFSAPTSGDFWTAWGYHTMNFTAGGSAVTINFMNLNPTTAGFDLGLDDVSVTSNIPEPSTWALLVGGLLAVSTIARRSRSA